MHKLDITVARCKGLHNEAILKLSDFCSTKALIQILLMEVTVMHFKLQPLVGTMMYCDFSLKAEPMSMLEAGAMVMRSRLQLPVDTKKQSNFSSTTEQR